MSEALRLFRFPQVLSHQSVVVLAEKSSRRSMRFVAALYRRANLHHPEAWAVRFRADDLSMQRVDRLAKILAASISDG